jgi:hypothetical protein
MYAWGGTCDSFTGLEKSYQNQSVYGLKQLNNRDYFDTIKNTDEIILMKPRK